jgi:hypothetical protein
MACPPSRWSRFPRVLSLFELMYLCLVCGDSVQHNNDHGQSLEFRYHNFWKLVKGVPYLVCFFWSKTVGRNSSVGIATLYVFDGPGIESRWGRGFQHSVQTGPGAHPASYTMGTGSRPHLAPRLRKEYSTAILLLPLWAFVAVIGWTLPLPLPFTLSKNNR